MEEGIRVTSYRCAGRGGDILLRQLQAAALCGLLRRTKQFLEVGREGNR